MSFYFLAKLINKENKMNTKNLLNALKLNGKATYVAIERKNSIVSIYCDDRKISFGDTGKDFLIYVDYIAVKNYCEVNMYREETEDEILYRFDRGIDEINFSLGDYILSMRSDTPKKMFKYMGKTEKERNFDCIYFADDNAYCTNGQYLIHRWNTGCTIDFVLTLNQHKFIKKVKLFDVYEFGIELEYKNYTIQIKTQNYTPMPDFQRIIELENPRTMYGLSSVAEFTKYQKDERLNVFIYANYIKIAEYEGFVENYHASPAYFSINGKYLKNVFDLLGNDVLLSYKDEKSSLCFYNRGIYSFIVMPMKWEK